MTENVQCETIAMAQRFNDTFGTIAIITVDQLDSFLTDEGVMPNLDFDKDTVGRMTAGQKRDWTRYLQARSAGRRKLNSGGRQLSNGSAFRIDTLRADRLYKIRRLVDAASNPNELVRKVKDYADYELREFRTIKNQLNHLMQETALEELEAELVEVRNTYEILDAHAKLMTEQVDALLDHYRRTADIAMNKSENLFEKFMLILKR